MIHTHTLKKGVSVSLSQLRKKNQKPNSNIKIIERVCTLLTGKKKMRPKDFAKQRKSTYLDQVRIFKTEEEDYIL